MGYIYMIENNINHKKYIGKTYKIYPSKNETSKYCSNACKNAYNKLLMIGNARSKNKLNGSKNGRAKKLI